MKKNVSIVFMIIVMILASCTNHGNTDFRPNESHSDSAANSATVSDAADSQQVESHSDSAVDLETVSGAADLQQTDLPSGSTSDQSFVSTSNQSSVSPSDQFFVSPSDQSFGSPSNQPSDPSFDSGAVFDASDAFPTIEAGIESISKYGNITLTIGPQSMQALGFEPADVISVKIGDSATEMPIGTAYTDVDSGEPVCVYKTEQEDGRGAVVLAINTGSLASTLKLAEIKSIDADPGYEVIFSEGFDQAVTVYLSMVEKQGYAEEYEMHQLAGTRTNKREDYANLSDAEYANFRAVGTSGMGTGTLYRSSSPINPALNRNKEADAMISDSLIRTIINMADQEQTMKAYPGYNSTAYSKCDIIALNMGMDFQSDDFRGKLVQGYRYMASHEGPYLMHCNEGKDRTGFGIGVLECLMGASAEEVVQDYMLTFYNFYGIKPESEQYAQIADSNIKSTLAKAFGIESIDEEGINYKEGTDGKKGIDLAECAAGYLKGLGMNDEEISALKDNLRKDYGGIR